MTRMGIDNGEVGVRGRWSIWLPLLTLKVSECPNKALYKLNVCNKGL